MSNQLNANVFFFSSLSPNSVWLLITIFALLFFFLSVRFFFCFFFWFRARLSFFSPSRWAVVDKNKWWNGKTKIFVHTRSSIRFDFFFRPFTVFTRPIRSNPMAFGAIVWLSMQSTQNRYEIFAINRWKMRKYVVLIGETQTQKTFSVTVAGRHVLFSSVARSFSTHNNMVVKNSNVSLMSTRSGQRDASFSSHLLFM